MLLVSTPVAAEALGIDESTLRRWARAGLIEPDVVTVGGQYRWDIDRVRRELLERRRRQREE